MALKTLLARIKSPGLPDLTCIIYSLNSLEKSYHQDLYIKIVNSKIRTSFKKNLGMEWIGNRGLVMDSLVTKEVP